MKTTFPYAKLAAWLALPFATLVTLLAAPLDHWHGRNPPPAAVVPSGYLTSVTTGNGLFIAAGSGGRVFKSSDAVTWVEIESGLDDEFTGLGYDNGLFVGLAASKIFTSPDGEVWTERALTTAQVLTEVASGNGQCVAVGYRADGSGVILSSPDGVEWTPRPVGTVGGLNAVAFGDGLFVAVGSANTLVTSPDGLTWTARDTGAQALNFEALPTLLDVAHADGRWVVVGWGPERLTGAVAMWATSSDGLTWTPQRFEYRHRSSMGRVFWDGTSFVADGLDGDYIPTFLKSASGTGWELFGGAPGGTLDLIATDGVFVAVGYQQDYDGSHCLILTSPDLVNWTTYQAQATDLRWRRLNDVVSVDGVLVAGGNSLFSTPAVALRSTDGRNWSGQELASAGGISRLIYANGRFVGVGGSPGYVVTSTDGLDWTFRDGFTSEWLRGIAFGNGLFVAVGTGGCVLTSSSGTLWQTRLPQTPRDLFGVAFGNGRFVAVGAQGAVLLSDNGVDWGYAGLDSSLSFTAVAFGQATFVSVGTGGLIRTSADGEAWTPRASGTTEDLLGVAHIVDRFLALGRRGTLLVSPDGGAWTPVPSGTTADLYGATAALGSCFVVGDGGTILQSDPFVDTAPSIVLGPTSWRCLPGATVLLSVEAVGTSPFRYQWFKDDVMILNATNQSLALFGVQHADAGRYTVVVRNPIGTSPPSAPATLSLSVDDLDGDGYLDYDEWRLMTDPADPASHPEWMPIGVFTGGDAGEGLDLDGQFVYAVDIGATGPIGQIRDAAFTGDTAEGVTVTFGHSATGWHDPVFGTTEADGFLELIISSIRYSFADNPTNSNLAVTLSGLHPGSRYQLQLLFAEHGWPRGFDVFINDRQFLDDFSPAHYQGGYDKTRGVVVTYVFTAQDSALTVVLDGRSVTAAEMTDHNPFLQGLTLEDLGPAPIEVQIDHVEIDGMGVHLTVNTQVGQSYALQYRASLVSGTWDELPPVTATGTRTVLTDDLADHRAPATGFWRVVRRD